MLDSIALVISLVAAALATYAAVQTYHLDKASFRVSNYHQFDALLIEIDKQLIELPQLSAIFDAAPFEGEPLEKRRLEAFVHMHLDLFQMVHSFIEDRTQKGHDIDHEFSDSWLAYMRSFIHECPLAREMLAQSTTKDVFQRSFIKMMDEFVASSSNKPLHPTVGSGVSRLPSVG